METCIGFIGLGIMGRPMAKNLLKAGYRLVVHDVAPDAVRELVVAGAEAGGSPKGVALRCDVVCTMLPNSPHVRTVVLGPDGVLEGARPGAIVIDLSSIAPLAAKEIAAEAAKVGVTYLDAPVSGGEPKAVDGTLSIMVGGPVDVFARIEPLLGAMSSSAVLVGDVGSGSVAKLANQIVVALNIAAMSEALVLATKAGVDPEKVYRAIRGGLAGSTVLDAKAPKVLARDFRPGFRIELHVKDLANALDTAREVGSPLPLTGQVQEMLVELKEAGMAGDDHAALVRYFEKRAGIEVKA